MSINSHDSDSRRQFLTRSLGLTVGLGAGGLGFSVKGLAAEAAANEARPELVSGRFALLVGNGLYPAPFDLPPAHKNVFDLAKALANRGFDVTQAMDLDASALSATITRFVERLAQYPKAIALFYYAGHGMQLNSQNLLLGSGSNPSAPQDDLLAQSIVLQSRLLAKLPARSEALNMTVIDACRTDLRAALALEDGLNQMEAPLGSLVCFSTAAGQPAIAPASPDKNTFYTASLVKLLNQLPGSTTFQELFRLVKRDVEQTMLSNPLAIIRQLAQKPFIADNTRREEPLGSGHLWTNESEANNKPSAQELQAWQAIANEAWPPEILKSVAAFEKAYPVSALRNQLLLTKEGANRALAALQLPDVRLYRASFVLPEGIKEQDALVKAARGDKDAAARIGRSYQQFQSERAMLRFEGWMQYAAALGNGIASYELALHYRETGQALLAAQAEAAARALGYKPPRSLGHDRK